MALTRPYRLVFYFVALAAVIMSGLAVIRPYLLKVAIDDSIIPKDGHGFIKYIILMIVVLLMEVVFQFAFIYYANWLGQSVIRDMRKSLFRLMVGFKMKYYDRSAIGRLTTRAVNDVETISS